VAEDFPHLLSPLRVGPKTVRNRVLVTGHVDRLAENNLPTPAQAAYQAARARGGAGLQITGAQAIHSSGKLANPYAVENLSDEVIPGYRLLADAVHAEGGLLLAQLAHSASTVGGGDADRPTWAPSPVAGDEAREVPHAMTRAEIAEMIEAYGKAAARVRQGGLDGAEILAAFGYLPIAFLSPNSNKRTDAYGGSLENRLRFAFEVIEAVRAGAGPDIIVGLRIPGDERSDGGLALADMQEIAQRLAGTGRIDYLNVIAGTNMDRVQRWEHWPPTPAPHGLFVELAAAIKAVVRIPVFVTGRITDPRDAERVLRDGKADMVGMTRAHIADPDLVAKLKAGRLGDIRPCVGANVCITTASKGLRCFHNPEVGRETAWGPLQPAERPKRVAVIGGGPAGMEAARVAALRGHRVTLYEREAELGGQLRRWARAPRTAEFGKSVAWFEGQLERLQVRVERGRTLSAEDLATLDAEVIVLATGALPKTPRQWPGQEGSGIAVSGAYAVIDAPPEARHAVVRDEGSGLAAFAAAEALLAKGAKVTVVTSEPAVAEHVPAVLRTPLYKALLGQGVVFRPNEQVLRLEPGRVVSRNLYSGEESIVDAVDLLVDWSGAEAEDSLVEAAAATGREVRQAGDMVSPRSLSIAVAEGALAARRI
jgi:2,4-dienoyl-CoA reductase-like NADH-dependent reductase (Old Yellow Enzyme family)/thioredoxin reductase